ncbi:MAG: hypothetical protein HKO64_05710 [Xanthomonadales bacterium]|nr:hypothetical protein [Xanthomonadales bacterium]
MQLLEALNYMGPNRRFDCTAIEMLLQFDSSELEVLRNHVGTLCEPLRKTLEVAGVELPDGFLAVPADTDAARALGGIFCQTCIALQRWAGHEVAQWQVLPGSGESQQRFIYQHEERSTAEKAGDTVMLLLVQQLPGLVWTSRTGIIDTDAAAMLRQFETLARPLAMPRDTLDIIAAARSLDVPCVRLERDPYQPLPGPQRIRANSLLMLGHSRHRQVVDGTICVTRSHQLLPLLHDRNSRLGTLQSMGLGNPVVSENGPIRSALLAAQKLVCIDGSEAFGDPRVSAHLEQIAQQFPCGLLLVTYVEERGERPVNVQDLDFAPRLDSLPLPGNEIRKRAAEAFIQWIFPAGTESRIPSIVVTGTNGKSTTTTMVDHIMRHHGLVTGVAYSSGVKINGVTTETGDLAGLMGHYRVFESPEPQVAILETARGGVAQRGFAFDWCDTAVCLNVDDDHIGLLGIDTVEQMAELKCSIVARARNTAVLNADDRHCRDMIKKIEARNVCLVSTQQDVQALRDQFPGIHHFCVTEHISNEDWLVFYQRQGRVPLVQTANIPATSRGRLTHNVINAAHAAAAALETGVPARQVASALRSFKLDADTLLGRWNELEGLPFKVIFDYAHNEHGMRHLVTALDQFEIGGTRRVAFAYTGDRGDETTRAAMRALKPGFDKFLVTEFEDLRGRNRHEMRDIVRAALIAVGVEGEDIEEFNSEDEAVKSGLHASRPGDLLVVLGGKLSMRRIWQQLCDYRDQFQDLI